MGRFTMVENAMWEDPDFRVLDNDPRLVFLWLWSSPQSTIGGLYHCSEKQMLRALEPGAGIERIPAALDQLAHKPLALYDFDNEVVWVVNRARHANRSPRVARKMSSEVEACPDSPLVREFVKRYGQMLALRLKEE